MTSADCGVLRTGLQSISSLRQSLPSANTYDFARKDDMEFERQMDKLCIWLEKWDHKQRCQILEKLLQQSTYTQFQFLYTVMQPSLHRDLMYTAQTVFPTIDFTPVSTHTSREYKEKVKKIRKGNIHRVKSAYLQLDEEVKAWLTENSTKLPPIENNTVKTKDLTHKTSPSRLTTLQLTSNRSPRLHRHVSLRSERQLTDKKDKSHLNLPIRRHLQEISDVDTNSSNLSISTMSSVPSEAIFITAKGTVKTSSLSDEAKILLNWYTNDWSDKRKNEFLHKLVVLLDPRQHYYLSSFLSVKQHRDFIKLLPEKIALKILSYLNPKELLQARRVSKTWRKFADNNDIWKTKCSEVKVEVPAVPVWKDIYRDNMYLRFNWNSGICHTVDLKGHTENVLSVIFDKNRVVSGSLDKTIKVWNIKTGDLIQTLKGHTKGIWCLNFFTKNLLVSGAFDCTIKIWNLRMGTAARTLLGHEGPIWAMVRNKNILVSASQDKTARVWDIGRCLLLQTLKGHNAAVFAVDMNEDGTLTLTGSADRSVRIWDTKSGKCKKVVWASQSTSIMSVSYSKGFFACCYGETICLYRVEGAKLVNTYLEHHKRVESIKLSITDSNSSKPEGIIVSAGKDGMVKYWDINQDTSLNTFSGHAEQINCIHFDELRIASASYDHKIRLWDFNV
ncbi:F-box/WD repeat-containing protein 7 isoform X1 [Patella vulgata]|uniref:F-box/WD repeat-containing protein 7 isoform X1 n=2 Tax=Patella vulgata TaxID=6465 RepID=UPI0024A96DCC|nr:F-box/WD repeat-containing protein 7 isoform X1 [Patella vulgata]